jgi:hypothetical protein
MTLVAQGLRYQFTFSPCYSIALLHRAQFSRHTTNIRSKKSEFLFLESTGLSRHFPELCIRVFGERGSRLNENAEPSTVSVHFVGFFPFSPAPTALSLCGIQLRQTIQDQTSHREFKAACRCEQLISKSLAASTRRCH